VYVTVKRDDVPVRQLQLARRGVQAVSTPQPSPTPTCAPNWTCLTILPGQSVTATFTEVEPRGVAVAPLKSHSTIQLPSGVLGVTAIANPQQVADNPCVQMDLSTQYTVSFLHCRPRIHA